MRYMRPVQRWFFLVVFLNTLLLPRYVMYRASLLCDVNVSVCMCDIPDVTAARRSKWQIGDGDKTTPGGMFCSVCPFGQAGSTG